MALATYPDLVNAVAGWLHRDDLASSVPDFIALAEARLNRDVRVRQQMTTATLVTVAATQAVALPADWLQFHRVRLSSPDRPLTMLPGPDFEAMYRVSDTGAPRNYTVEGSSLLLGPVPDSAYSIEAAYYAKLPTLTALAPTNWLLTAWPSLYLYAALAESAPYLGQDSRRAMWEMMYATDLGAALATDRRARASGSTMRMRAR
ncbi:MAG: hypothetical protein L6Q68_03025 [Aquabacterium sp.]|nr:hypothetical protein [Aquabacterium sp.]